MLARNGGFPMTPEDKARYASLSPAQRIMVDEGMPVSLMWTQEERKQYWIKHPPTAPTNAFAFTPPDAHLREAQQAERRARAQERFAHLKATRPPKEPSPLISIRAALVDISTISKEFELEPRMARALLRKAQFPKPAWGWAFNDDQAARVRQILTAKGDNPDGKKDEDGNDGRQRETGTTKCSAQAAGHGGDGVDNQSGRPHRNARSARSGKPDSGGKGGKEKARKGQEGRRAR